MSVSDNNDDVSIVDAMSGATLLNRRYVALRVDTSGALMWRGVDSTVDVTSGPNSVGRTLTEMRMSYLTSFRYGVAFNTTENRVLRFDVDREPTAEPHLQARAAARATLLHY